MKQTIRLFNNCEIRTIEEDGLWFSTRDICKILHFTRRNDYFEKIGIIGNIKKYITKTKGGIQKVSYINKEGLGKMILLSKTQYSAPFKNWLDDQCFTQSNKNKIINKNIEKKEAIKERSIVENQTKEKCFITENLSKEEIEKIFHFASDILEIIQKKSSINKGSQEDQETEKKDAKEYKSLDLLDFSCFDNLTDLHLFLESKNIIEKSNKGWELTDKGYNFGTDYFLTKDGMSDYFLTKDGIKIKDFRWNENILDILK